MHIIQPPLLDFEAFVAARGNEHLVIVLEALDAEKLIAALEREHSTGRKGYSVRGMWAAFICGLLRGCESLADIVRLLDRDKELRTVCGFVGRDNVPGEDALGRFMRKLVLHGDLVQECFEGLVEALRKTLPGFGQKLVTDSTEIRAYSNGHHTKRSDPDARWGAKKSSHHDTTSEAISEPGKESRKGKKRDLYYWFGYKLHLLIDATYELPVSFAVTPANESDTQQMPVLLEKAGLERPEARPEVVIADKDYDSKHKNQLIYGQYHTIPIIPIIERDGEQLPDICNAKGTPTCCCGLEMAYWGRDGKYLKYRCPQVVGKGVCKDLSPCTDSPYGCVLKLPISDDVRRHPPIPRESKKWERLYKLRTAVERVNSRVKELLGLRNITVRGLAKVTIRSILSLLTMLAVGLGMAQRIDFRRCVRL